MKVRIRRRSHLQSQYSRGKAETLVARLMRVAARGQSIVAIMVVIARVSDVLLAPGPGSATATVAGRGFQLAK